MKDKVFLFLLCLFSLVLYFLTLRGIYGNPTLKQIDSTLKQYSQPFESSHERSPYAVVLSLDRDKKFDLDRDLADIGAPDVSYYKDKFYSFFPIGIPILIFPFYLLGKTFGASQLIAYSLITLFAAVSIVLIYLILKNIFKKSNSISILGALIFGFSTTSWSYAITIYQHIPSTFLFLLSFYSVWKYKNEKKTGWIWALIIWFSYGFSIFLDYPNAILMLPIMIYFFISSFHTSSILNNDKKIIISFRSSFLITSFIFFVLISIHLAFNQISYGGFKNIPQSFPRYERDKYYDLLQKIKLKEQRDKLNIVTKKTDSALKEDRLLIGIYILLFDNDKGIFFYSPILLFGAIGIFFLLKKQKIEGFVLLFLSLVNLGVYASFGDPWGGWAYGPRYLIPSMSFLSIGLGEFVDNLKKEWSNFFVKIIVFVLFIYSSGVALLGALTTNIIPPKVEAIPLKLKYYNYFQNFDYLKKGVSGSFIFNEYASKFMSLKQYFLVIYISLILLVFSLLFIVPLFVKKHES